MENDFYKKKRALDPHKKYPDHNWNEPLPPKPKVVIPPKIIIEKHGGKIWIDNLEAPHTGLSVRIELPAISA